jgi:hypothetical protein
LIPFQSATRSFQSDVEFGFGPSKISSLKSSQIGTIQERCIVADASLTFGADCGALDAFARPATIRTYEGPPDATWCNVVYHRIMSLAEKSVRQSVSLPERVARRVKLLAATSKTSTSRVMVDLIESGLAAQEQEKKRFFALADSLSRAKDPKERKRLKEELARMTFGD